MADFNLSFVLRLVDRLSGPLRGVMAGVSGAARSTGTAQQQLDKLGRTHVAIDGFARLKTETAQAGAALTAAQAKVADIARAMLAAGAPAQALERSFAAAKAEAGRLKTAHGELQQRTEMARRGLTGMGVSTRDLAATQRALRADVAAAGRAAEQEAKRAQRLASAQEAAAKRGALTGKLAAQTQGVTGAAGTARASLNVAGDFEHGLAAFGNATGATNDQLAGVRAMLLRTAGDVNQTAPELLAGLRILTDSGLDFDRSVAAIAAIGKTATATGVSVADLSATAATLINNLKLSPDDLPKAMEMLTHAANHGRFGAKNMAQYLPQLTQKAKPLGIKGTAGAASLAASLQVALKGSGDPSQAANNMASFLDTLTTEETVKKFRDMGINIEAELARAAENGGDPIAHMLGVIQKTTNGDQFKLSALFSDKQALGFIRPMLDNMEEYQRIKKETEGASGLVDEEYARIMATYNEQTKAASIAVSGLSEAFGRALIPVVIPVIRLVAGAVRGAADLVNTFPRATAAVTGVVAGFMAFRTAATAVRLATIFGPFLTAIPGPLGLVGGLLPKVAAGIRAIGVAMMANPIGLVILAVAAAAYLIYSNWSTIGPWFWALWDKIAGFASDSWNRLKGVLAWTPLGLIITNWDTLTGWFDSLWPRLTGLADTSWTIVKTLFNWSPLGIVIANWDAITGWLSGLWVRIQGAVSGGIGTVGAALAAWSPMAVVTSAWDGLSGYFSSLWDSVTGIAGRALDWIDTKIKTAIGWITSIQGKIGGVVDWVSGSLGLGGDKPAVAGVAPPANANTPPPANANEPPGLRQAVGAAPAAWAAQPASVTFNATFNIQGPDARQCAEMAMAMWRREAEALKRDALHD